MQRASASLDTRDMTDAAWTRLAAAPQPTLRELFAADPDRVERLSLTEGRALLQASGQRATVRWSRIVWQEAIAGAPGVLEARAELEPLAVAPLLRELQPNFGWSGDLQMTASVNLRSAPTFSADVELARTGGDLQIEEAGLVERLPGLVGHAHIVQGGCPQQMPVDARGVALQSRLDLGKRLAVAPGGHEIAGRGQHLRGGVGIAQGGQRADSPRLPGGKPPRDDSALHRDEDIGQRACGLAAHDVRALHTRALLPLDEPPDTLKLVE